MNEFLFILPWLALGPLAYAWVKYEPLSLVFRGMSRIAPVIKPLGGRFPRNRLGHLENKETGEFSLTLGHYAGAHTLLGWSIWAMLLGASAFMIHWSGWRLTAIAGFLIIFFPSVGFQWLFTFQRRVSIEVKERYLNVKQLHSGNTIVSIPVDQVERVFIHKHLVFVLEIYRRGFESSAFCHQYGTHARRLEITTLAAALETFGIPVYCGLSWDGTPAPASAVRGELPTAFPLRRR